MAAGTLPSGAPVHRCLHCGLVIAVAGDAIVDMQKPARQPDHPQHLHPDQPRFDLTT
jgi:hypothetical protein